MKLKSFFYAFICTLSVACIQEERFEGNLYETPDKVYAVIAEDTESKTYLGDEIKVLWSRKRDRKQYCVLPFLRGILQGRRRRIHIDRHHIARCSDICPRELW